LNCSRGMQSSFCLSKPNISPQRTQRTRR
jgi:hypothetical protein